MNEKKFNKNISRLVIISIIIALVATSANSAVIKTSNNPPPQPTFFEEYYEWKDEFDNEQLIDASFSSNYTVSGGKAKMKGTFSIWTNPQWTRMKPVTVVNNGGAKTDWAVNFIVNYDSDMKSDYGDVRFKYENIQNFLSYWIEDKQSSYASIWVKVPNLAAGTNHMYMFYGNPAATDQSNYGDTFTSWSFQHANDWQISYHASSEGAWDPDVCYGSGFFLVAWEEGPAYYPPYTWGFKQEIRASVFVAGQDEPVVFDNLIFKDSGYTYYRNENPSIAYSGSKWYVAWEHYSPVANPGSNTMDIKGAVVTKSGSSLSVGTVYDVCNVADSCQADANVVYDSVNNKFMVVWEDARDGTGDYDIWAQLINPSTGAPIGSNVRLCNDANSQCEPWATFDPVTEKYFVVWEDGVTANNGPFRIKGGIFDENLNSVWTGTIAEPSSYPNDNLDYNFPCVRYDQESERFLVTWQDDDISDGDWRGNIYGKIYDASGAVKVDAFTIKSGNFERTEIIPYLSQAFFVTFDNNQKVYGKLVSSNGVLYGGDVQITGYPSATADWASIDSDGSNIFCAWEDLRITYPPQYDDYYPDAFGNCFHLNIASGSDLTITFGTEEQLYLSAVITSVKIHPDNLESWYKFLADFLPNGGNIFFDIMDESGYNAIIPNVSPGQSLAGIDPDVHPKIRCRTRMSRTDASYTPELNNWSVLYEGIDLEPPVTTVEDIDGIQGQNDWYTSETVTVWLKAVDYPEDTGSGINLTYYTLDGGPAEIYNEDSGILLATFAPDWWDVWVLNFWSVDNTGNEENHSKPENYRTIKIDSEPPTIFIYEPTEEQEVEVPFWVRATVTENAELDHVEFDIEPFGEREGLPFKDYVPPWEWYCNVEQISRPLTPLPASASVQIRADAYDKAGHMARHQVFVTITNWNARPRTIVLPAFREILENLKLGFIFASNLDVKIYDVKDVDAVKFTAKKILTGKQTEIFDTNYLDGFSASFNIPSGLYRLGATYYSKEKVLGSELISRVLFINK